MKIWCRFESITAFIVILFCGVLMIPACSDNRPDTKKPSRVELSPITIETLHPKFDYYLKIIFIKHDIQNKSAQNEIRKFISKNISKMRPLNGLLIILDTTIDLNATREKESKSSTINKKISLTPTLSVIDIKELSKKAGVPMTTLGSILFDLETLFSMDDIYNAITAIDSQR